MREIHKFIAENNVRVTLVTQIKGKGKVVL